LNQQLQTDRTNNKPDTIMRDDKEGTSNRCCNPRRQQCNQERNWEDI